MKRGGGPAPDPRRRRQQRLAETTTLAWWTGERERTLNKECSRGDARRSHDGNGGREPLTAAEAMDGQDGQRGA
ncbi:hypothetical protein Syun_004281 [Stephania yunnanensis]|uniref:Uncharacterized protein n=1 Tax=Stephania yunnanensis TaxID=152371 RepID=A0AAP0L6W6_9MAGN